jgi:sortase A
VLATSTERYRLIIPKIGVDIPIIINEQNEKRGLARGAWQIPGTAEPGEVGGYGNMVLSAHRYLYTSGPHTFFNLDKLAAGDEIIIEWLGETYRYVVEGSRVVPPTEVSILNPTSEPLLTLFTCTPVFSTKNRLVITARSK